MFSQTHLKHRYYPQQSDGLSSSSSRPSTARRNESIDEASAVGSGAKSPTSPARPRTTSSAISDSVSNLSDLSFNPFGLSRTNSIYTLGRTSFAAQLNQLVCIDLPDPNTLSASISAIPTAAEACKALSGAAPQIKRWIDTAAQILSGLDTEDDIELVSSGDESVQEVDTAVTRFAELINIYVAAIDSLQKRSDVSSVPQSQISELVNTLEALLRPWGQVQKSLEDAKSHVKLAKEWEELWNTYMGEIRSELDDLERLIFQLEEKRHTTSSGRPSEDGALFDMDERDLTPIAEEGRENSRDASPSGVPSFTITSPLTTASTANASEDSGLLALFARMQPVQASLSFLPIRLASFRSRAAVLFPTACQELDDRRNDLEARWQKLEKSAETLRDELSEDRWIDVFRNAGRQATKMCQSVDRGIKKLNEAILTTSNQGTPASTLAKKVGDYENKKTSFGPAIQKILAVIDKGVADRRTVNGEVLKIQAETRRVWDALQAEMKDMDTTIRKLPESKSKQLREGVASIVTKDLDQIGTPGSSPDSFVEMPQGSKNGSLPSTPDMPGSTSSLRSTSSSVPKGRRPAGLPVSSRYLSPRSVSGSSTASTPRTSFSSVTPRANSRTGRHTPASAPAANKPRWSGSTVVDYTMFPPHKRPDRRVGRGGPGSATSSVYSYSSSLPHSPLSREHTASPSPANRRLSTSPARTATTATTATSNSTAGPPEPRPRHYKPSHLVQERLGMVPKEGDASAAAAAAAAASGRRSAAGSRAGSRLAIRSSHLPVKSSKEAEKPRWRP